MSSDWGVQCLSLTGYAFKSKAPLVAESFTLDFSASKAIAQTAIARLSTSSAEALGFVSCVCLRLEILSEISPGIARLRVGPFPLPKEVDWGLAQGWQCWSESPIVTKTGLLEADAAQERWVFGDNHFYPYEAKRGSFHAWFFSYCGKLGDPNLHAFMCADSADRMATCFVYDLNSGQVWVDIDTEGLQFVDSGIKNAVQFVLPYSLSAARTLNADVRAWQKNLLQGRGLRLPLTMPVPVHGYASWYHHYFEITADLLQRNLTALPQNMGIFQIDDGYQKSIGEWTLTKEAFGPQGSVEELIQKIKAQGAVPGLWLAPFVSVLQSDLLKRKPHFLLHDAGGKPVRVGNIAHWGGDFFALDTELPEFKSWLEEVIDYWTARGVGFFKCDFLYAPGVSSCGKLTRLERAARAHEHLHQVIRTKGAVLLSCGGIIDQAFGRCEFSRIGADIGQTWLEPDPDLAKKLRWSREKVSTVACLTNTLTRALLSGSAFYNDADVAILRDFDTQLSFKERKLIAQINALCSDVQFISCDIFAWGSEARELYELMTRLSAQKWTQIEKLAPLKETDGIASQYYVRARNAQGACVEKSVDLSKQELFDHPTTATGVE